MRLNDTWTPKGSRSNIRQTVVYIAAIKHHTDLKKNTKTQRKCVRERQTQTKSMKTKTAAKAKATLTTDWERSKLGQKRDGSGEHAIVAGGTDKKTNACPKKALTSGTRNSKPKQHKTLYKNPKQLEKFPQTHAITKLIRTTI